jgi:hypothetical protein
MGSGENGQDEFDGDVERDLDRDAALADGDAASSDEVSANEDARSVDAEDSDGADRAEDAEDAGGAARFGRRRRSRRRGLVDPS